MPPKVVKSPIRKRTPKNNLNIAMNTHKVQLSALPPLRVIKSTVDGKNICPFYTARYCLSNHYVSPFTVNGNTFYSSEQYYMYRKAAQFHDFAARQEILDETDPRKCKSIGRRVQNFDRQVWDRISYDVMVEVLTAKFSQNQTLKDYLLATGDSILVEAAPRDKLWGIGMGEHNIDVANPSKWKGRNLLGNALMQVREQLK